MNNKKFSIVEYLLQFSLFKSNIVTLKLRGARDYFREVLGQTALVGHNLLRGNPGVLDHDRTVDAICSQYMCLCSRMPKA